MPDLDRRRFLFVTGKGGVGKTTVCAALALALAESGRRVLVAVMGAREGISSLLGTPPLRADITELRPGIFGVALSAGAAIREYGQMKLRSRVLAGAIFENRFVQSFFAGAPGLKEWALLGKAWYHSTETVDGRPRFDTVLFDAPSTGHGLDMLRVPKVILDLAPPGVLRADAERAWHMFQDPTKAGAVVVTLPEELPVNETEELVQALRGELELPIAALVVNGVRESIFDPRNRAELSKLVPQLPFGNGPGEPALAAGVRRAERERSQAENQARLHALSLTEIELPWILGGAATDEALTTMKSHFAQSFAKSSPTS
ncbi:MAG TPA: ArsA-related P-loop ATPase [Polyangiaceae bacterium]